MPALRPSAGPGARAAACRLCGRPLAALRALRSDVCERPDCLRRRDQAALLQRQAADCAALLAGLSPPRPASTPARWIRPHAVRWVELPAVMRAEMEQYLFLLAADPASAGTEPAPPDPAAAPASPAEGQLCAWCQGRCCRYGGDNHAYIDASHLRRWQQAQAGASLADAAREYARRLPDHHAQDSCHYHGRQGCTLTRAMRSSVCNRFACDGLRGVQAEPSPVTLFVMGRHGIEAAALADADGLHPL